MEWLNYTMAVLTGRRGALSEEKVEGIYKVKGKEMNDSLLCFGKTSGSCPNVLTRSNGPKISIHSRSTCEKCASLVRIKIFLSCVEFFSSVTRPFLLFLL